MDYPNNAPGGPTPDLREYKRGDKQVAAYEYIRNAIMTNAYPAQKQLGEKELSAELGGISRTPIRDALRRLTYEGLVENLPGKGMFVAQVSVKDLLEISEMRIPLECLAVGLFIERADRALWEELEEILRQHEASYAAEDLQRAVEWDNRFHEQLARGSMNHHLYESMQKLLQENSRGAFLTRYDAERVQVSIAEHKRVLDAMRETDTATAAAALTAHISDWIAYIKELHFKKFFLFNP